MCWPSAWRLTWRDSSWCDDHPQGVYLYAGTDGGKSLTRLTVVNDGTVDGENDYDRCSGSQRLAGACGDWQQERVGARELAFTASATDTDDGPRQCYLPPGGWFWRDSSCGDDHASGCVHLYAGELIAASLTRLDVVVNDGTVDEGNDCRSM
ncbi:MAG: hypothetical protein R3C05_21475 [Pirellulaceae bacterium]